MRPTLLRLDEALSGQSGLHEQIQARGGSVIEARELGPALRLWSRPPALEALADRLRLDLPASAGASLVFAGSGDFHHVAALLIARAVEASDGEPMTVIHFDNHPDWVRFDKGIHCGSWVAKAARLPGIAKFITVGVCSRDINRPNVRAADLDLINEDRLEIYPYCAPGDAKSLVLEGKSWLSIATVGEAAFRQFLPSRIKTPNIYVSVDKDVLLPEEAATNWDQGRTSLAFLKAMIGDVAGAGRVIGMDVVGDWSRAAYGGGVLAGWLKRGEAMLDQPWSSPPHAALAANEKANLALLQLTRELGL